MNPNDFEVDLNLITNEEVEEYLRGLNGRDRNNRRRIQAWLDNCARIRNHPRSLIPGPGEIPDDPALDPKVTRTHHAL